MKNSISDQHNDDTEHEKEIVVHTRKDEDVISSQKEDAEVETTKTNAEEDLPEKWKTIPFEELKLEGWRPRIKKKQGEGGREYLTIRRTWRDADGRTKNLERGLGPFDETRYRLLQKLLIDKVDESERDPDADGVPDSSQHTRIQIAELESGRGQQQPPGYLVKGTRILQSAVGRHISIPDRFYYDTDILEFYEYFRDKGYRGSIVDFMHDCVRNYLIEHRLKIGVIIERQIEREMEIKNA